MMIRNKNLMQPKQIKQRARTLRTLVKFRHKDLNLFVFTGHRQRSEGLEQIDFYANITQIAPIVLRNIASALSTNHLFMIVPLQSNFCDRTQIFVSTDMFSRYLAASTVYQGYRSRLN